MLDIVTLLNNSNKNVVYNRIIVYSIDMAEDMNKLNKYETELYNKLSEIMKQEEVNFAKFLPVFVDKIPVKSSPEYFKVLKKEQMKLRRASFSLQQVHDMLELVNWEFKLSLDNKPIELKKYALEYKIRFADLMGIAELMGINITFAKKGDRGVKKDKN